LRSPRGRVLRAIGEASQDVAASYGQDRRKAADAIARLVARHGE